MKDDKIIRAISDIDDAYILEAAPDSAVRGRKRYVGMIVGLAAAAVVAATGLFAFGILSGRSGSAQKAADARPAYNYEGEIAMEEAEEAVMETEAAYYVETRKEANNADVPEVGGLNPEEAYYADDDERAKDETGAPAADEWENDGITPVSAGVLLETAEMPDGTYYVLVYAAFDQVGIEAGPNDTPFTIVREEDGVTLYKAEKRPVAVTVVYKSEEENIEVPLDDVAEEGQEISEFFRNWIEKTD
ncbi:MAG: hypothetical protein IKR59_06545 [Lachnospiraceae bacterium]|nr:hypothetical protein [Lachnospiraceae bacterium]